MEGEKSNAPILTASDDYMDLLDGEESPWIKVESPPLASMDVNMVFNLLADFRGVDEEIAQLCLGPKWAIFEKLEESSQDLKHLYIRGHIDVRQISGMLVDGGAVVNLMPYSSRSLGDGMMSS
jgi:hypothetical protein